ncbi:MAG: hypothetical protein WEC34_08250 [Acidimicrobiia bacterium]
MTEPAAKLAPTIPLLLFAAIDLGLAFFLLADGGFTFHFFVVFLIGLALAGYGLYGVYRRAPE